MAIQNDWALDYVAKTITHSSGTTVYTVNALYSWLMDLFDDASQMDDLVPMSASTPSEYSFINGWTFGAPSTDTQYLKSGAITDTADDTVWSNIYTIGSDTVISSITLYIEQNGSVVTGWWSAGHIDILIKTKNAGTLIDSGLVTVFAREWTYTYDHYEMDLSAGGRQPAPIAVQSDSNNQTASSTVAAYTIGVTFGTYTEDVDQSGATENYEIKIDLGNTYTVAQAYEYLKYITRRGETGLQDGVQGQIYVSANPATYVPAKAAPFGTFAGGKLFGARGLYFDLAARPAAQANLYELTDSDGNVGIKEPTSITIQVTGLDTADRVFVARASAGVLVDTQYTTAASGNGASSATVTITGTPDADTPNSGVIRLQGKPYTYSSYSGSTFTLDIAVHPGGLDEANNSVSAYVPFLDKLAGGSTASVGVSYSADREVLAYVRQKGIIPFATGGTVTSAGYSVQAIRTADNVVT